MEVRFLLSPLTYFVAHTRFVGVSWKTGAGLQRYVNAEQGSQIDL